MTTVGSLFTGYGGLDMAVRMAIAPGARVAWNSDVEPGPCTLAAVRWPDTPNLGDITKIDWADVEPVDIICGGSPCQDLSSAGRRAGMASGTRSGLWGSMFEAIKTMRPRLVVWENVRGALTSGAFSLVESEQGLLGAGARSSGSGSDCPADARGGASASLDSLRRMAHGIGRWSRDWRGARADAGAAASTTRKWGRTAARRGSYLPAH